MGFIEAILALIGLVAIIAAVVGWRNARVVEPVANEDLAAPYREGLHAAIRIQGVAQDLDQQLYAETIRHADGEAGAGDSSGQYVAEEDRSGSRESQGERRATP